MKRTKTQKGITLVALIITIIVLLILAVVTINAVKGDGIIQKAESATQKYNDAAVKEQAKIDSYIGTIKEFEDKAGGEELEFVWEGKTYTYEKGMTWGDWVENQKYDSEPFYFVGDTLMFLHDGAGELYMEWRDDENEFVKFFEKTDEIDPNLNWSMSA